MHQPNKFHLIKQDIVLIPSLASISKTKIIENQKHRQLAHGKKTLLEKRWEEQNDTHFTTEIDQ